MPKGRSAYRRPSPLRASRCRVVAEIPPREDERDPTRELCNLTPTDRLAVGRHAVDQRKDDAHQQGQRENQQRWLDRPAVDPGGGVAPHGLASRTSSPRSRLISAFVVRGTPSCTR
jgi:hypothetical protein